MTFEEFQERIAPVLGEFWPTLNSTAQLRVWFQRLKQWPCSQIVSAIERYYGQRGRTTPSPATIWAIIDDSNKPPNWSAPTFAHKQDTESRGMIHEMRLDLRKIDQHEADNGHQTYEAIAALNRQARRTVGAFSFYWDPHRRWWFHAETETAYQEGDFARWREAGGEHKPLPLITAVEKLQLRRRRQQREAKRLGEVIGEAL